MLKLRADRAAYAMIPYKIFLREVNSQSRLNFLYLFVCLFVLPVGMITRDPVHLRVWDILQVWVDRFPAEIPAVHTIFWSHNNMCTLLKM